MSTEQPEISSSERLQATQPVAGLEREVRRARLAQAAHFDALVDVRDAQTLRLSALHADLKVKLGKNQQLASLLPLQMENGFPPRLWIDDISFVIMEPDPRTFTLMRQDASGRETIFSTRQMPEMIAKLQEYASHRLIEKQRSEAASGNSGGAANAQIVMAWLTGFTFGVLGMLILGYLLGRISF